MAAATEIARLTRVIEELREVIAAEVRRPSISVSERRTLRSEIETCMRNLDELRSKLSG